MPRPSSATEKPLPPLADLHPESGELLALWLVPAWFGLILFCAILFNRLPGVMVSGQELGFDRALFLSISSATLTGFQQTIGPADFNPDSAKGPVLVLVLVIAGSLFTLIVSGLAAARILRLRFSDVQMITAAVTVELLAVLAGSAALMNGQTTAGDAMLQAACAFGNCGAAVTSHAHLLPPIASLRTQCVLLPLAILGGLGLPVLLDLYDRFRGSSSQISNHSRSTAVLTAGVYLLATGVLFVAAVAHRHSSGATPRSALLAASTMAVVSRTAGLPYEKLLSYFPAAAHWIIVVLMMIGASPAGTGGGIKINTLGAFFTGLRDAALGRSVTRTFGIAGSWIAGYLILAGLGFFLLTMSQPQWPADRLMFVTISALSNVGLSHDPISLNGGSLMLLACIMVIGRLAPLGVLWWVAQGYNDGDGLVG